MKRGQVEMVGLVFVVFILVFGIIVYLKLSAGSAGTVAKESQGSTSFLIALLETDVPNCDSELQTVIAACAEGRSLCRGGAGPCHEAQRAIETVTEHTLVYEGMRFNLSVSETELSVVNDCESGDTNVLLSSAFEAPIVLSSARIGPSMQLSICRPE